jgi:hypothetical protein
MRDVTTCIGVVRFWVPMLLVFASAGEAQRTTGDLLGVVRDASGAILPGVTVTISGPRIAGTQSATTSENGTYRIPNLPPGTYTVKVELSGFKSVVLEGIRINLGGTAEQNVALEIGQLAETVSVVAESPVIDTTSNEVGTTFDQDCGTDAASRLLRSAGPGSGVGQRWRRDRGRRTPDDELWRVVRRKRLPA